ncbi:ArnT family glycosyltransferase [Chlorobium ferrooxidans]|uniref:Glycosyl transferase, family 39 n=1 Tax=Chlorobium ferrooxidans DSM 13031 TaxID=377431 RepID=Q0YUR6_9CHLB|nr:glycosyltransferase family 39 protein [Chlorobium ferrooxidans]EAT59967.1 Glycosyl transferase, family 39 [Chlorobium ferrooxidans DSM 13031]
MQLNLPKSETTRFLALLGLLVAVSFFAGLGSAPLFDVDEGAFSEATREMMVSKNYLTTWLNGAPRFDKPILIYWLQLLSVNMFGVNEFAFRLPSALAGTAWAASIFVVVRKVSGNRQAFLAAALMVLSLQVNVIAKAAIADALLNALLAITMFALFRHFETGSKRALYLAFAMAGFGMLTKGPIAVIIPVAVFFIFSLVEGELKKLVRATLSPWGIIIFLCIALPWYLLEYREQGMAFIEGFFFKHNISRFNTSFEGHSGSLFYYFPVLIIGLMPFTGLLFTVLFNLKKLFAERENRFLLIWFGFVFIFFSLSGTKLPHYVIYGYTPLFILMARALPLSRHPRLLALWPMMLLILLLFLPLLARTAMNYTDDLYLLTLFAEGITLTGASHILVIIASLLGILAIEFLSRFSAADKLIATGVIFALIINIHLMPIAGKLLQEPVKEAALLARKAGYKIVMWEVYYPSFFVYSESFAERREPLPGEIALTTVKQLATLDTPAILYSKRGIVLVKIKQ